MSMTFYRKGDGAKISVSDPNQADAFRKNPDWELVVEKAEEQVSTDKPAEEPAKKTGKGRVAKR